MDIEIYLCAEMKKLSANILLILAVIFLTPAWGNTQPVKNLPGYHISVTLPPYKNDTVFLASYYGKSNRIADTVILNDKSEGVFEGKEKLPRGIYFLVSPERTLLFEILMDDTQQFSVQMNSENNADLVIKGSAENSLFAYYTRTLGEISPAINKAQQHLKSAINHDDSTLARNELRIAASRLTTFRDSLMKANPFSMLATLLNGAKIPEYPRPPVKADGTIDSLYPFYYVKDHYWDGVDFFDERFLRTPYFEKKLDDYFKQFVAPHPDSIVNEISYMLLSARESDEMLHYLLAKFTDKYINPEIMGQDKVFLYLFEEFYLKGDTAWLSAAQNKYILDRGYSLIANQINEQAAPMEMLDTSGKPVSLYDIHSPYTFVAFWDPHCGHCKDRIPVLDSFYRAKWKDLGVEIFSVNVNENVFDDWVTFINEHHLQGWIHAWQTREQRIAQQQSQQANFRQLYDVQETPTFFLLDAQKRIIAKKLSLNQFDEVLTTKTQKPGT